MKTKICSNPKCKKEKSLSEFYFRKDSGKYRNECKECINLKTKQYYNENKEKIKQQEQNSHEKYPWKRTLVMIKQRCGNPNNKRYENYGGRGIECWITEDELKELWFRDEAWKLDKPSIDRKDNDGHYEYGNCRYIEMGLNSAKRNIRITKSILQYDLNDKFIREWKSIKEARIVLNINASHIGECCRKLLKTCGGYKWEYKK